MTIPLSASAFLLGQLNLLARQHSDIHLAYGPDSPGPVERLDQSVTQHVVGIRRHPSPWQDLTGLVEMLGLVRRLRPGTVVMGTPKMGLLGLLAARISRVPRRIYILYGLRLHGASGPGRLLLWCVERLTMACATEVIALSESNRQEALGLRLVDASRITVLGAGSIGGVDTDRFRPSDEAGRGVARSRFGLPGDAQVVGFLGRLTPDKGIEDLAKVWKQVHDVRPGAWLLVAGPDEATGIGRADLVRALHDLPNTRVVGAVSDPESAFAAMDLQLLLTRREGFGMVLVEAAGCGVPSVVTRVNGTVDAVVDGVTSTLVEVGDVAGAVRAVLAYLDDQRLLFEHRGAGLKRVREEFEANRVNRMWVDHLLDAQVAP